MTKDLIDATETDVALNILAIVIAMTMRLRRQDSQLAFLETASVPLDEKPKNAYERRQHAISVFMYKHLRNATPLAAMLSDLEDMRKLGRTERWHVAITTWQNVITNEKDLDWAISQYAIFTNYSA